MNTKPIWKSHGLIGGAFLVAASLLLFWLAGDSSAAQNVALGQFLAGAGLIVSRAHAASKAKAAKAVAEDSADGGAEG